MSSAKWWQFCLGLNVLTCLSFPGNITPSLCRSLTSFLMEDKEHFILDLYSLSGKTSNHKISWSLEAARFGFKLFQSLWNLAGTSAALLSRCLSNFSAIRPLQHPISRLRDFTRFGGKTSYRLVNKGPAMPCLVVTWRYKEEVQEQP